MFYPTCFPGASCPHWCTAPLLKGPSLPDPGGLQKRTRPLGTKRAPAPKDRFSRHLNYFSPADKNASAKGIKTFYGHDFFGCLAFVPIIAMFCGTQTTFSPADKNAFYRFSPAVNNFFRCLVWHGVAGPGVAWLVVGRLSLACVGLAWLGVAWRALAWLGLVWRGSAWLPIRCKPKAVLLSYGR
jgi:hypothetical protein